MTSTREARDLLGPVVVLNDAVRESFPALASGWADHSTAVFMDGTRGPGVMLRPGARVPAGSVLGPFAGTIRVGSPPRGHAELPLPARRPSGGPGSACTRGAVLGIASGIKIKIIF
jgi:hypothetical protein